jgi:hypothetical protein
MIGLESIYKVSPKAIARKILDETLLVPIRGNMADMQQIYSLTPVAEFIWHRFDGCTSLEKILEFVLDEFDVQKEKAQNDLLEFCQQLLEAELIERIN